MTRRLSIAMVAACPFPYPRGTPVRIQRLAEALVRRGHDVNVVTYQAGKTEQPLPFPVIRTPKLPRALVRLCPGLLPAAPGPTWAKLLVLDPLLVCTLLGLPRRKRFDLIHAHHYEGLVAGLAAQAVTRLPLVYDAHTMLVSELHHYGLGLSKRSKQRIAQALERLLPRRATHVVTVTDDIRNRLITEFAVAPERVTTVSNGVELEHFTAPATTRPASAVKTIIFSGNLAAYQGIELLLEAFALLRARRGDVRLVLVVEAATDGVLAVAERLGVREHVNLIVSDFMALPRHLAAADVAVSPRTECDGQPVKVLNYMAAGKAIVSFAGSAKRIVHGETGLVVGDGDIAGFADALDRLLEDGALASRLGNAARLFAERELSWDRAAQGLELVYERALSSGGGA